MSTNMIICLGYMNAILESDSALVISLQTTSDFISMVPCILAFYHVCFIVKYFTKTHMVHEIILFISINPTISFDLTLSVQKSVFPF